MRRFIFTAFILASRLFFTAPLNTYFINLREYGFQFFPLILNLTLLTLTATVLLILIPFILQQILKHLKPQTPSTWLKYTPPFYVILALLFTFQSRLLALDIGFFDDRPINWSDYTFPILFSLLFWIVGLALFFRFRRRTHSLVKPLGIILLAMQISGIIPQYLNLPQPPRHQLYYADGSQQYTLSPQQNVIIIVLDTFQADLFDEILLHQPEIKEQLSGFTYYPDTAGVFQATNAAIPLILTGKPYTNDGSFTDYIKQAYLDHSLPQALQSQGYQVNLYCNLFIYCDPQVADGIIPQRQQLWLTRQNWAYLLKPTFIRVFPSIFYAGYKKAKYEIRQIDPTILAPIDESHNYFLRDQNQLQAIQTQLNVTDSPPSFHFYHFTAAHPPLFTNAQGEYERQEDNRTGHFNHSLGALQLGLKTLDALKQSGAYDQSLILLMSDHGYGPLGYKINAGDETIIEDKVIASALPLLLVKPFNSRHPFTTNQTPVSFATLSQDILSYLESNSPNSTQAFTLTPSQERHFYHYPIADAEPDHLPPMDHYLITGPIRDPASWAQISD